MKRKLLKILVIVLLVVPLGLSAQMSDLIFSEYGEGTDNNRYLELYNGTGADLDLSKYVLWKITNEGEWWERKFPLNGTLPHGQTYTIVNYNADSALLVKADTVGPVSGVGGSTFTFMVANGNESFAIAKINAPGDTSIIDVIGEESETAPDNWDVAGVDGAGAEHTWVRKRTVSGPNPVWSSSAGTDADNSEWIVYGQNYWSNVGYHSETNSAPASDLFFSEYGEGTDNNKYLELYNGTGVDVDLSKYVLWKIINEGEWYERAYKLEGILPQGKTFTVVNYKADSLLAIRRDTVGPVSGVEGSTFTFMVANGNEAFAIAKVNAPGDTSIIDVIGDESGETAPDNWDVAGVDGAGAEHTWIRKSTVGGPNASWSSSAGTNADDSEWIVYPQNYWKNVSKHSMYLGPLTPTVNVTFSVDMNQQTVATEGVHIFGDFQGWDPSTTIMDDTDADGVWTITVSLEQNQTYEYKFINGDEAGEDETVPAACAQNSSRFVTVTDADLVLDTVCYASCNECAGLYDVTFKVDMNQQTVAAAGVHIFGDFQGWDPAATPMTDSDADGIWEVTVELGGNTTYQYRFINGNSWGFDEVVPNECAENNSRTVEVETTDLTTEALCFGECDVCGVNAIFEYDADEIFTIYPNPSNGQFNITCNLPREQYFSIRLYNILGQLVQSYDVEYNTGNESISFNVEEKGVFLIEITGEEINLCKKIIVD